MHICTLYVRVIYNHIYISIVCDVEGLGTPPSTELDGGLVGGRAGATVIGSE